MPNNTAAYENPWPGGQWRVLHLACHQAIQATANKRYNTTFLPRNDRPNPSYFSNSTGINPPWNAAHRMEVACIVFRYGLFSVSCTVSCSCKRTRTVYNITCNTGLPEKQVHAHVAKNMPYCVQPRVIALFRIQ